MNRTIPSSTVEVVIDTLLNYAIERIHTTWSDVPVENASRCDLELITEIERRHTAMLATYDDAVCGVGGIGEFLAALKAWESLCLQAVRMCSDGNRTEEVQSNTNNPESYYEVIKQTPYSQSATTPYPLAE